jgi:hypothetical protein
MDAGAHSCSLLGYAESAKSEDQISSALSAFSTSRIGATAVGRDVGAGGACFDCRTAASALGKKTRRFEGISQQAGLNERCACHRCPDKKSPEVASVVADLLMLFSWWGMKSRGVKVTWRAGTAKSVRRNRPVSSSRGRTFQHTPRHYPLCHTISRIVIIAPLVLLYWNWDAQ